MACSCVLTEYNLGCRDNAGGVQRFWLGCYDSDTVWSLTASNAIIGWSGATVSFYKMDQEQEVGSFIQNINASIENGTIFYEQVAEMQFVKMTQENNNRIATLGQGKWRVIILDQNGKYWLMGFNNAIRVSAGSLNAGKALGDLNGALLTFTGKEPNPANEIDATFALSILG